jgi:hypothetical protein
VVDEAHVLLRSGVSGSSLVEVHHIALNGPAMLQESSSSSSSSSSKSEVS